LSATRFPRTRSFPGGAVANPLDANYGSLNCRLTPLAHKSETMDMLKKYVKQTHAKTHNRYTLSVPAARPPP
jgi:poly [ADP-ribose] polymerase